MKIYIDEYHRNGKWTIKSRTAYTKAILENPEYYKEYKGDGFKGRMFFKFFFQVTAKRKLTKTLVAKTLKMSRFTLYSIIDGYRLLKPRELDVLYTICLEEEYIEVMQRLNTYLERIRQQKEAQAAQAYSRRHQ